MLKVLLAVAVAALAIVSNAGAKNSPAPSPSPSIETVVDAPTPLAPAQVPAGGIGEFPGTTSRGAVAPSGLATAASGGCGACIVTCWGATTRAGSDDWSGHAWIYHHLSWCGNGAVITYAYLGQTYDQAGWYSISGTYGPWWVGGCVGCSSIAGYGYIMWNWTAPLIGVSHSGTSNLTSTMYAWGGLTF